MGPFAFNQPICCEHGVGLEGTKQVSATPDTWPIWSCISKGLEQAIALGMEGTGSVENVYGVTCTTFADCFHQLK